MVERRIHKQIKPRHNAAEVDRPVDELTTSADKRFPLPPSMHVVGAQLQNKEARKKKDPTEIVIHGRTVISISQPEAQDPSAEPKKP